MSISPPRRSGSPGNSPTMSDDPEVDGLLALMLLHHARRSARTRPDGSLVTLADQDRSRWDERLISEGVARLQPALARDRLGPYQAQAAIAALHADAQRVEETDWVQIVSWYDELLRLTDSPVVRLNRAVAVGEADGAPAGLAALAEVADDVPRRSAVAAHLHERNGDLRHRGPPVRRGRPRRPELSRNAPTRPSRPPASTNCCAASTDGRVAAQGARMERGVPCRR